MKTTHVAAWVLLAAAAIAFRPASTEAQSSFPIVCRGGGNPGNLLLEADGARSRLVFFLSTTGASQAGSCGWVDRAVGSSEPHQICLENSKSRILPGFRLVQSGSPNFVRGESVPANADADRMVRVIRGNSATTVTFNVVNDFSGCLRPI